MSFKVSCKNALICHENVDFTRDLIKSLGRLGWCCASVVDADRRRNMYQAHFFIIMDVNVKKRHFEIAQRCVNSDLFSCELFIVNAMNYEKSDWQKIKIYTNMMEVRSRLVFSSEEQLLSGDDVRIAV
jgi:hypothetical protein